MIQALLIVLRLSQFSAKPQDLPASWAVFYVFAAAYLAVSFTQAVWLDLEVSAVAYAVVDLSVLLLYSYAVLFAAGRKERYLQTATALLATAVVTSLLLVPLAVQAQKYAANVPGVLAVSILVGFVWFVALYTMIYRHALSSGMGSGLLTTMLYLVNTHFVMYVLFPEAKT